MKTLQAVLVALLAVAATCHTASGEAHLAKIVRVGDEDAAPAAISLVAEAEAEAASAPVKKPEAVAKAVTAAATAEKKAAGKVAAAPEAEKAGDAKKADEESKAEKPAAALKSDASDAAAATAAAAAKESALSTSSSVDVDAGAEDSDLSDAERDDDDAAEDEDDDADEADEKEADEHDDEEESGTASNAALGEEDEADDDDADDAEADADANLDDDENDGTADAQVALATESTAMATDEAAAAAGVTDGATAGWRWGSRRRRRRRTRRRGRGRRGRRRGGLYRWYIRRFKLKCARGKTGRPCRRRRRIRFRAYLRARRRASRKQWRTYRRSLRRSCAGPWKTKCPTGTTGDACRTRRNAWRSRCRRRRMRARRSSCKGPWRKACPAGTTGAACRATRASWRKACRARRRANLGREKMARRGRTRVARLKLRVLRSQSQHVIQRRRVNVMATGSGTVLEFLPATGFFNLYKQDRSSLNGKSANPMWNYSKRLAYGTWTKLKGYRLRYVGKGIVFAHHRTTGAYLTFKINYALRGNRDIFGAAIASGTYKWGKHRKLVSLGGGRLLVFGRRGRYRIVTINGSRRGTNVSGVIVTRARGSSWLLARRRAKYAYIGKGVLLQWHGDNFRMIAVKVGGFRRTRRGGSGKRRHLMLLKTVKAASAMGRSWPYRSGAPYTRMASLGGKALVFYRTTSSTQKASNGLPLYTLKLTPFQLKAVNNPRFGGPMMSRPWLVNKPWLLNKAWRTKGGKPWRNDPRYCLKYNTFPAKGTLAFTQRGEVARLDNAGRAGSVMVRLGASLLDLDKSTGSYRVLTYSQRARMYVQRSFGILPQFKPTWDAVAINARRLMLYNPTTRRFLLYPVRRGGSSIGRPVASGVLPLPAGWKLISLGRSMLAWRPATGQWRVYRTSPYVSGVNARPMRKRFMAAGQWCDIKTGKDILALNSRDLLVINKRSGEYTLYRFNAWARGRRGNVFKDVRARGTWDTPFLSTSTRLVATGRAQVLGFKPTSKGSIYSTWTLGYVDGGTGNLGSLKSELKKFVGTVKQLKRYIKLGGKGKDPALGLLQKPTFAGMPSRDFHRLFSRYLQGVDVKFPWKSTLKYFQRSYIAKQKGEPLRAEGSDGSLYAMAPNGQPFPDAELPPQEDEKKSTTGSSIADQDSSSSGSNEPTSDANYPVTPSGPQAEVSMDGKATKAWPDGKNMETDDVFDDGTGPAAADAGALGGDLLFDLFDTDTMDPAGEGNVGPQFNDAPANYPDVQWHDHIDMSDAPEDDSMSIGDHTSPGITHLEREVPHATDAGPGRPSSDRSGLFAQGTKDDPVGDQRKSTGTYPDDLPDYVGGRDDLEGPIVVGDGEPPVEVSASA